LPHPYGDSVESGLGRDTVIHLRRERFVLVVPQAPAPVWVPSLGFDHRRGGMATDPGGPARSEPNA